jgi:hypothetical protein
MPKEAAAASDAALRVQAGDLALDKLKDPDAAEKQYREAARLSPKAWDALLGLAACRRATRRSRQGCCDLQAHSDVDAIDAEIA